MLGTITKLTVVDIIDLLKLCLDAVTFSWKDVIYKQKHGVPIGSPVLVALAELSM